MKKSFRLCLVDTGVFLCLAFEDSGYQQCGMLLDKAFRGDFTLLLSSIQLTELYTPFLRAKDLKGLQKLKREILKLKPRVRNVDREIAEKAAEYRSTVQTPDGKWLALADSVILATSIAEKAEILYTLDTDFAEVKHVKVKAPEMEMSEWVRRYGTPKQRKTLHLLNED
jgi:predicted nucleic acid-binding protein